MEQLILSTLSHVVLTALHPRTAISVVIQILQATGTELPHHARDTLSARPVRLQDDGSMLGMALNAVCVALLHAGVPLRGMLAGCTVAMLSGGEAVLDPTAEEVSRSHACSPHPR
jgi:exosome complex component RRP46